MSQVINRRGAMKTAAIAGAGYWIGGLGRSARADDSPNEKINVAFVGIGGRGRANLKGLSNQNIVALCDVDDKRAGESYEKYPGIKKYFDFRKMLTEMENEIDGVVVTTPDHTHFHPSLMALEMGKALYCEKPMAHNVWEVRHLTNLAREKSIATQLGVQRHAKPNMARIAELIQAGAIGDVSDVYCRVSGKRGMPKVPTGTPPVPSHLKWDLWLGPAEQRDYQPAYCPYDWHFWWDFGTGETGNWGCHILDIPFRAIELDYPTRVDATGPELHELTTPTKMQVTYKFAANAKRPGVTLHWAHSDKDFEEVEQLGMPAEEMKTMGMNTLFVGSKGKLLCGFDKHMLLPSEDFADYQGPEKTIPKSPGFYKEWIAAAKGGEAATCNFDYSGPLTETVLLGNIAYRAGGFDWDPQNMKTLNNSKAQTMIREAYRPGWKVG